MENILSRTFQASADYSSTGQYRFVYLSAEDTITLADGSNPPLGVLMNDPESGQDGNVMLMGIARLSMSASCAVGARIGATTSGQGVAVTADDAIYNAIALQACGNANEEIRVLLVPGGAYISGSGDD